MRALPFGFGLIIAALISLIIIGAAIVRADLAALHGSSKENVFWSAAQVEREFNALQVAVARHALQPEDEGASVRRHFDLLWSRLEVFKAGEIGRRLTAKSAVRSTIDTLQSTLHDLDADVQSLGNDSAAAIRIGARLAQSDAGVRRATIELLHTDEARFAAIRDDMRSGLIMTAGAVLLSLLLAIGAALIFKRQALRSAILAAEAREAGESKLRFFSMMSHEIRTPLNGLLGALNLLRDMPSGKDRARLFDEAGSSAHRLSDVLTDALTLGADEGVPLKQTVFSSVEIATAQQAILAGELQRRNATLSIDTGAVPAYGQGDATRLNNAASHLLLAVLQRGGATEVALQIRVVSDAVRLSISSDAETPPEAFGETLARGLVEASGGTFARTDSGWQLSMPASRITPRARLFISSVSLAGLYQKLLAAEGIGIVASEGEEFEIALTDPMLDEVTRRRLRERHPTSRIVACGPAASGAGFDAVLTSPDDLRSTVATALSYPPLAA